MVSTHTLPGLTDPRKGMAKKKVSKKSKKFNKTKFDKMHKKVFGLAMKEDKGMR